MPQYTRRPQEQFLAVQWRGDNFDEVAEALGGTMGLNVSEQGWLCVTIDPSQSADIENVNYAAKGDYIAVMPLGLRQVYQGKYFERNYCTTDEAIATLMR